MILFAFCVSIGWHAGLIVLKKILQLMINDSPDVATGDLGPVERHAPSGVDAGESEERAEEDRAEEDQTVLQPAEQVENREANLQRRKDTWQSHESPSISDVYFLSQRQSAMDID